MYTEGSFFHRFFTEFPDVTIRVTKNGVLGSSADLLVTSVENRPSDPQAAELWDYLQSIPELL